MGKIIILNVFEKIMTSILILFVVLNLYPNTSSILFDVINKSQATISSIVEMIKLPASKSSVGQQPAAVVPAKNAEFNQAVAFTLQHEGGLVNDKADKGGITNYGISYTFLHKFLAQEPQYLSLFSLTNIKQVNPSIIKNLTMQQAVQIYNIEWWVKYHFGAIQNQAIATKAFDYSVNMGSTPAIKLLQAACQKEGATPVTLNGQLDNATITYINSLNPAQASQLLSAYENGASKYYSNIVKHNPADKKFLSGWLQRANDNTSLSL